ncbi:hypothetical protein AAULR_26456 [Lacticaseibacillus rhamnosus MTCC 5462]|nr:hypothetical protein AAULR_26456 [Lacticaseibacillus rhamnosus MTCC 5462]
MVSFKIRENQKLYFIEFPADFQTKLVMLDEKHYQCFNYHQ